MTLYASPTGERFYCANCYQYCNRNDVSLCIGASLVDYWLCDACRKLDDYEWCEKHQAYHLGDCENATRGFRE